MKLLFGISFIILSLNSASQPNLPPHVADSLWQVWQDEEQADTNRLWAINKYAWAGYLFTEPDSAFYFSQLQYDFAKSNNLKAQMAYARNTQGVSFAIRSDYDNSIEYFTQSLILKKQVGDKKGVALALNNIGNVYKAQGNYTKAIECYTQSLQQQEEIGDKFGIANSLNNIGIIYLDQSDYKKAMDNYSQSLKIREEIGDQQGVAGSLNNIGLIYRDQGEHSKALNCYTQSLKIFQLLGNQHGIAVSLNNIGTVYKSQGDSARESGNKVLSEDMYEKALDYFNQSLQLQEKVGDQQELSSSLKNIGNLYLARGNYSKALDYNTRALQLAQEVGAAIEIQNAAESLWDLNKKLGKYKQSLEMYELFIQMRDSILSEESQKEVIRQEYEYEYEKQAAADSVAFAKEEEIREVEIARQKAEIKARKNQQYALFGGLILVLVFAGFMYNRFKVTQKQKVIIEKQKSVVELAHLETQKQKEVVEEAHREIRDSINYAKRIQSAILPPLKLVKEYLPESFIMYRPKDVVAGDFYWMESYAKASDSERSAKASDSERIENNTILFAACDCTGHGVPGAMVSVVCVNGLNRSVREHGITDPGKILDKTREIVIAEFEKSEEEVKDGMDISLCAFNPDTKMLQWAGANNPLWIIRANSPLLGRGVGGEAGGSIDEIKPNKQPIGKVDNSQPFTTHNIQLQKGDSVYIFTDGLQDQFGGEKGKKFKAANFKNLLLSIQDETMGRQREIINEAFENWKRELEQVDDICIIGFRI